ncbi:MAG: DUF151 domain-containing protein [Nitrososphaerales archaeon]
MREDKNNEYVYVKVTKVGFADPEGAQGILVLTADDGRSFPMSAFSGEVADYIARFQKGDRISVPSIYKMIAEIADIQSIFLTEVEVYERGNVLRADLYFRHRNNSFVLKNYRASDSIALATYYDVPIKMKKALFDKLTSQV